MTCFHVWCGFDGRHCGECAPKPVAPRKTLRQVMQSGDPYWPGGAIEQKAWFAGYDAAAEEAHSLLRRAANLVYRIEAAGPIDDERTNFERWKADARALAPDIRAALATQPATSPMKMAVDRDWLADKIAADPDAECDAGVMHPEAPQPATSQEGEAREAPCGCMNPAAYSGCDCGNKDDLAREAIFWAENAATPTPPTLSEDLRIDVRAVVSEALGDHQCGNRHRLKERLIADFKAALARAQVKAS